MADASYRWRCPRCYHVNDGQLKRCPSCKYESSVPASNSNGNSNSNSNAARSNGGNFISNIGQDFANFFNSLGNSGAGGSGGARAARQASNVDDDVIIIDPKTNRAITTPSQHSSAKNATMTGRPGSSSHGLWTCAKCTFAANPDWQQKCEICELPREVESLPPLNSSSRSNRKQDENNNNLKSSGRRGARGAEPPAPVNPDLKIYDTSLNESIYDYNRLWACKACTYLNYEKNEACELCLSPRSGAAGPQMQDASNSSRDAARRQQAADKPSASGGEQLVRPVSRMNEKWICRKCTYINSLADERCVVCHSAIKERSPPENPGVDPSRNKENRHRSQSKSRYRAGVDWVCEVCSHKNKPSTDTCAVCANNRDSVNNAIEEVDEDDVVARPPQVAPSKPPPPVAMRKQQQQQQQQQTKSTAAALVNPSLTYRSQRARSIIKTYNTAQTQAEKTWNSIVRYCKENGHKFVDDSFPPCDKSLFIDPNKKPDMLNIRKLQWLSPEYIRTHADEQHLNWTVYNEPKFNDIKQGLLGNCWFLSGLAVILEKPELLQKIIITKEFCPQGCYQVRLCHNGDWQTVIIDDLFPCDLNGCLVYSQASRKQLWVPLIEKAMAKLNGSYEALIAGQTIEGLSALTGYPCDSIRLENSSSNEEEIDYDVIWARLLSMKEFGYVMGASCGRTDIPDDTVFTSCGLLPRHAYSLLNVKEINGNQLIQLRNPWGRYTWQGDWSESSPKWTPEIRRALGLKPVSNTGQSQAHQQQQAHQNLNHFFNHSSSQRNSDQGVFWMSFKDFVQYFCSIDICKTRVDWFESRMSGYFKSEGSRQIQVYHLVVFETCEIDIGLFHKTLKNRRENGDLDLSVVVLRSTGRDDLVGRLVVNSKRSVRKFIGCEHIFEPGEYIIVPLSFNFWYTGSSSRQQQQVETSRKSKESSQYDTAQVTDNNLYNLVIHSPKVFFLEQEMKDGFLLADTVIQLCLSKGQKTSSGLENACMYTLTKGWSGLIVIAENCNENHSLHIELNCERSHNVVSTRQTLVTRDSVPPLHRQVVMVLTHLEGSNGFSIQYSIRYRLSSNPYLNTWPGMEGQYITNSPEINTQTLSLHAPRSLFNCQ